MSTRCLAEEQPAPFIARVAALMVNVTFPAATGAALRHSLVGERFAYLRRTDGGISACVCPDRRSVVLDFARPKGLYSNRTDPDLGYAMAELRKLWRAALMVHGSTSFYLNEGADFVVILGDFDGNRHRRHPTK